MIIAAGAKIYTVAAWLHKIILHPAGKKKAVLERSTRRHSWISLLISHRYFKTNGTLMIPHTQFGGMQCFLMFESLALGDHSICQSHVVEGIKRVEYQFGVICSFQNKVLVLNYNFTLFFFFMKCCLVAFRPIAEVLNLIR